jgi:hypothetical protein
VDASLELQLARRKSCSMRALQADVHARRYDDGGKQGGVSASTCARYACSGGCPSQRGRTDVAATRRCLGCGVFRTADGRVRCPAGAFLSGSRCRQVRAAAAAAPARGVAGRACMQAEDGPGSGVRGGYLSKLT